jgi:E-phenylitaconyl-CoA hydratase
MAIEVTTDGPVLLVTLNRPERLNALTSDDYVALARTWEEAAADPEVRAVVLTGAGERAFCTGADLYDTIPHPPRPADLWKPMGMRRPDRGQPLWKPAIAAVRGYCLGGGLTLMLRTDLRVASDDAVFSLPEARWGIPVNSDPARLAPHPVAMEWMLAGERFSAADAYRHGLVNRVVPPDQVLPAALSLAHRIAAHDPCAVQATKELALRSRTMNLDDCDRLEASYRLLLESSSAGQPM